MDQMNQFRIPIKGLNQGVHRYEFEIGNEFFKAFEETQETQGIFRVDLEIDKQSDHFDLRYLVIGLARTKCDRCLTDIDLPIEGEHRVIVKFGKVTDSDDEIEFIDLLSSHFNVSRHLFEFIRLSIPYVKVFDCNPEIHCDQKMLDILANQSDSDESPFQEVFKNIKLD